MSARLIQVIETDIETRGAGVEGDPVRRIRQFWNTDGELLAEVDSEAWPQQQAALRRAEGAEEDAERLNREVKTLDATCKNLVTVSDNTKTAGIRIIQAITPILPRLEQVAKRSATVRDALVQIRAAIASGGQDLDRAKYVSLFK